MRIVASTAGLLLVAVLVFPGCSKRAWVASHGTTGYDAAPAPAVVPAPPVADTSPAIAAVPRTAPVDPAQEGGAPLPRPGALVAEQLPWEDEVAGDVGTAGGDDCARAPCHWVQIAAPVDSFGCADLLRTARSVLAAAAAPAGGTVRDEGGLWKVQIGPYARWEEAEAARDRLRAGGFPAAWLVRR